MRACLLSSYDADYAECGDLALATFRAYAEKWGLDLELVRDFGCGRPAPWAKIPLIAAMFNKGYDWVVWIDADALIIRGDEDILAPTISGYDLYLTCHRLSGNFLPGMGFAYDVPNTGVMLCKNSDWTKEFLLKVWEQEAYINHHWWENAAVMKLLGYDFLLDTSQSNCPNGEVMAHIGWLDWNFNSIPGICQGNKPFILHFAGQGNIAQRSALMRQALSGQYRKLQPVHLPRLREEEGEIADKSLFMAATDALLLQWRKRISQRLMRVNEGKTLAGPFKDFVWPENYTPEPPMLIGCYEEELFPVIEEIIALKPERIINVGAAEGYYAIGLAKRLPEARITAFEASPTLQRLGGKIASLNGVADRVEIKGFCHLEDLRDVLAKPALLLIDCEGGELELLDPKVLPVLAQCPMLVELHDFVNPHISKEIMFRFAASHDILSIVNHGRSTDFSPVIRRWDSFSQLMAVSEFRQGPMEWFWLRPKSL